MQQNSLEPDMVCSLIKETLIKDGSGFYVNVPVMILNTVLKNGYLYDEESFRTVLNDPESQFHKRLQHGVLIGELKYSDRFKFDMNDARSKFFLIYPTKEAVTFRSVSIQKMRIFGVLLPVVCCDFKFSGCYGSIAEQKLEQSSSVLKLGLRAATVDIQTDRWIKREIKSIITFDLYVSSKDDSIIKEV